jgi:glycerophosphoryl diester phosphodiesterase
MKKSTVTFDQLFSHDREQKKRKMVIQGHRGGFAPGNSMASFEMAIEKKLQAIELDVW